MILEQIILNVNNLNDITIMSAKAVIQGLEDSELIKIFLDFVQVHRLQYEKVHKEISYKCFEATWMLNIVKATGYGRTETQAYKNALKNLLELLMQDPTYIEYFSMVLSKQSLNKLHNKDPSPPPKLQLKTEGHEPQERPKGQYDSYTKIHYLGRARQEIHHSKINLNRSMSQKENSELEEARNKLKALQTKLAGVLEQNRVLKEKLINGQQRASFKKASGQEKKIIYESAIKGVVNLNQEKFHQKSEKNLMKPLEKFVMSKMAIPKLNLQVLPNYHKKSQKCLNDMLLSAYNEKHGGEKRLI